MEGTPNGNSGAFASIADAVAELDRRDEAREPEKEKPVEAAEDETDSSAELGAEESEEVATEEGAEETEAEQTSIEFDGKTVEIPKGTPPALVEAVQKLGSDLKADYTRKTQQVAQERQVVESAKAQAMAQADQLQAVQSTLAKMANEIIGSEPDLSLAQTDPQAYLVQKGMFDKRVGMFNQLIQQGQAMQAQQSEQLKQQQEDYRRREAEALLEKMPDLAKPEKFQKFRTQMVGVGERYGFKPEEISAITDHRMVLALRDLDRFHSGKAQAGEVAKKLANVPPKVAKPGPAQQGGGKEQSYADAKREYLKSPRTDRDLRRFIARTS